jgi:hypothetical protein
MDKYMSNSSTESRSSRNKKLYDELYDTMNYTNSVVIDQSKEIDISKIKEIVDRERKSNEKEKYRPEINFEELNMVEEDEEEKVYNINEVLKEAKEKRDIISDASEKRKNSRYEPLTDIDTELKETKKVYDKILQEETELLDIMNTLTSAKTSANIKEAYKDITAESKLIKQEEIEKPEPVEVQSEEEPKEEKKTKEYSTNTFMFNKKDFVDSELEESLKGTNGFIKALIVILTIGILVAAYYIIKTYILK